RADVDMARVKAELMPGWPQENGVALRERCFGQAAKLDPLASIFPTLSHWMLIKPAGREWLEQSLGIDKRRDLPSTVYETVMDLVADHQSSDSTAYSTRNSTQQVVLFVDIFTNYHKPEIGKAAVQFLEQMGYSVIVPEIHELGRPQRSEERRGGQ